MIWGNGGAMGYGRDVRGWRKLPRFDYRRAVDYVSGACLAVRNDVLQVCRPSCRLDYVTPITCICQSCPVFRLPTA